MCYMTTTTTVYTAPSSILLSIVSFSIPNAPIMSSATMFLSILPPPQKSLLCRQVVALMPPPLILLTLPPPLVCWHISSHLPLVRRLVVASPAVACLRLMSPFVAQPPHASILDPSSLFAPTGCRIASLCTAFASQHAAVSRLAGASSPSPMHWRSCR
jgi:hypothetical protein